MTGQGAPETEATRKCPVCSSAELSLFGKGKDRLFGLAKNSFSLLRCGSCRCIFQFPPPDRSLIGAFYPDSYWWAVQDPSGPRIARFLSHLERVYREFVASDHVRFLERCAKVRGAYGSSLLDIGCGSGTFIYLASRRGYQVRGMDASATAVRLVRELYGLEARHGDIGSDIWAGQQFDLVTMFHVLEHLPDPAAAIEYASSLLHPEGSLIVQVPNIDSIQAGMFGLRWYGLDVPRHLVNFSRMGLELLLERAGFRIVRAARFSLRDDPAALASSVAPQLDPIGRKGRGRRWHPILEAAAEFLYFTLVIGAAPLAWAEGMVGRGATIWVEARRRD